MDDRPIGVMDSGIGGLSVCLELRKILPQESIIFYGDTLHLPYGEKSEDFLLRRILAICSYLQQSGVKAIVMACNTASSVFLAHPEIFCEFQVPIFEVVSSTLDLLRERVKTAPLFTVLATTATVKSNIYPRSLSKIFPDSIIRQIATVEWATLVENFPVDSPEMETGIQKYLAQIEDSPKNYVLLGCTHYYYLETLLRQVISSAIFFNSSVAVANFVKKSLGNKMLRPAQSFPSFQVYVSQFTQRFRDTVARIFGTETSLKVKDI